MKVFIIEDDFLWSTKLQIICDEIGLNVVGTATTVANSALFLANNSVDLIIADILLKGESVFELFKQNSLFGNIPTILATVSEDENDFEKAKFILKHLYLLKPIHLLTLKSAIGVLLPKDCLLQTADEIKSITVKGSHNELIKLLPAHIYWIEQKRNYCFIKTKTNTYAIRKPLSIIAESLDANFLQIHRSYYINKIYIDRVTNDLLAIKIKNEMLPIGRKFKDTVKQYLSEKIMH
jgi:two-component system, LytTR family, response regulator LytT